MPRRTILFSSLLLLVYSFLTPVAQAAPKPVLRRGDRGPAVSELQSRLNTWLNATRSPMPRLPVNGVFGPRTAETVEVFQRAKGLPVTKVVAARTWAALPAAATSEPPRKNCDPYYPMLCIPPGSYDLDCPDISAGRFPVLPPDPHRFDGDGDGIGCEWN